VADVTAKGLKILMSIRSSKKFAVAAALAMSTVAASTANAALIQFSYSGNASGTWLSGIYSGQSFTAQPFTITASSLTELIAPPSWRPTAPRSCRLRGTGRSLRTASWRPS
jgi:hypothetical protein